MTCKTGPCVSGGCVMLRNMFYTRFGFKIFSNDDDAENKFVKALSESEFLPGAKCS